MFGENDNNPIVVTDDAAADAALDVDTIELKDGEENVTLPRATVEKLTKGFKTAIAQKQYWRGKATTKAPVPPVDSTTKPPVQNDEITRLAGDVATLTQIEAKRQFGHAHSYSPEIVDAIFGYANGVGKKPDDVLGDAFIKQAITGMQSQTRRDGNTPGPSNRSPKVEGKTFGEMDNEERKKHFGSVVGNLTGRSRG